MAPTLSICSLCRWGTHPATCSGFLSCCLFGLRSEQGFFWTGGYSICGQSGIYCVCSSTSPAPHPRFGWLIFAQGKASRQISLTYRLRWPVEKEDFWELLQLLFLSRRDILLVRMAIWLGQEAPQETRAQCWSLLCRPGMMVHAVISWLHYCIGAFV